MRLSALLAAAAALGLFGLLATAEEKTPPDPGEKEKTAPAENPVLTRILARLDKTNRNLKTLEAPYRQLRKVRISRRLRKAWGIFRLEKRPAPAGMRVLFEETRPHQMKLLFTDRRVVYHDLVSGKVEEHDPRKGGVRPSEIWILGRPLTDLRKSYTFALLTLGEKEKGAYSACLKLVPKGKKLRKWVREMHIWLDPKDYLPLRVKIIDPSGEYQEFIFEAGKIKRNHKIDPKAFVIGKK